MAKKRSTKAVPKRKLSKRKKLVSGGQYALPTSAAATTSNMMGMGDPVMFKQNLAKAEAGLNSEAFRQNQQEEALAQQSEDQGNQNFDSTLKTQGKGLLKGLSGGANALKIGKGAATAAQVGKASKNTTQLLSNLGNYGTMGLEGGKTAAGTFLKGMGSGALGAGVSIAGSALNKASNDNDATKYNAGEATGDVLNYAGKGAGIGSLAGPLGTAIGAGAGAIYGGVKGLVDRNKARKEKEKQNEINSAKTDMLSRAQTEAFNKSFTKSGTDMGFNTANSMSNSYLPGQQQMAKAGGALKGGRMNSLSGGAVEFVGNKHANGGIMLDKNTEVEGGETMDDIKMSTGKNSDYVFSEHLKLGGKSFARRHKDILKNGGSQSELQRLAKMQEQYARTTKNDPSRNPNKVAKMQPGGEVGSGTTYENAEGVLDYVPEGQSRGEDGVYGDGEYTFEETKKRNPWFDWDNFDVNNPGDVQRFQEEYNKNVTERKVDQPQAQVDDKWGEQTSTLRLLEGQLTPQPPAEVPTEVPEVPEVTPPKPVEVEGGTEPTPQKRSKIRPPAALLGGLSGLIGPLNALKNPYPKARKIGAEAARGVNLGRVNMNAERAANAAGNVAFNKNVMNQASGPGGMAAMLAAGNQSRNQSLQIANQEARQNTGLMNQEASLNANIAQQNMARTQDASKANAENQTLRDVNQHEQKLNAYKAIGQVGAGITKDYMSYRGDERLANAIQESGEYERFKAGKNTSAKHGGYIPRSNKVRRNKKRKK